MTNYHVLCCILHRLTLNRKTKARLWASSYLVGNQPSIIEDLKASSIFDDVVRFEEVEWKYCDEKRFNEKAMTEELKNICSVVGERYGKEIEDSDNLYVCQDTYGLGIYLNVKGVKYNFFEDGCGRLSEPKIGMELIKEDNFLRYKIVRKLKCLGESENVVNRFGDLSEQRDGYSDARDVDFSVKKILESLKKDELEKVLGIYHCRKYDLGKTKKDLLLTWHYNNMGLMTLDEQRMFFALLADYFKDESAILFIKPHPSDRQPDYKKWFKDAVVLERYMPAELLPYCIDGKFDRGITNWSTSIYGLKDILKDVVNFDKDIDDTWRDFDKYFAIVKYLDSIKEKGTVKKLILDGVNKKQFLQMLKHYVSGSDKYFEVVNKGDGIYIAKEYDGKLSDKKCIILDGGKDFAPDGLITMTTGSRRGSVYLYNLASEELLTEKDMKYSGYKLRISSSGTGSYIEYLERTLSDEKDRMKQLKIEKGEEIERLDDEVKDCRRQNATLRKEMDKMLGSFSWKITEPLRKINSIRKKYAKRRN